MRTTSKPSLSKKLSRQFKSISNTAFFYIQSITFLIFLHAARSLQFLPSILLPSPDDFLQHTFSFFLHVAILHHQLFIRTMRDQLPSSPTFHLSVYHFFKKTSKKVKRCRRNPKCLLSNAVYTHADHSTSNCDGAKYASQQEANYFPRRAPSVCMFPLHSS